MKKIKKDKKYLQNKIVRKLPFYILFILFYPCKSFYEKAPLNPIYQKSFRI